MMFGRGMRLQLIEPQPALGAVVVLASQPGVEDFARLPHTRGCCCLGGHAVWVG